MLSDCPKCWETPCVCGHEWRNRPLKYLVDMRNTIDRIIQEKVLVMERDWSVDDTITARDILDYLGIGSSASLEPGDRRRDDIACMIAKRVAAALNEAKRAGAQPMITHFPPICECEHPMILCDNTGCHCTQCGGI